MPHIQRIGRRNCRQRLKEIFGIERLVIASGGYTDRSLADVIDGNIQPFIEDYLEKAL